MLIDTALKEFKVRHLDLSPVVCVEPGTSLGDAMHVMKSERVACLLICEDDRPKGIFTERDLLTKVIGASLDYEAPIDELMTPAPRTLGLNDSVGDAIKLMCEVDYHHVPLIDGQGRVTAVLDVRDVIRFLAEHFPGEALNLPPRVHQVMDAPDGA